jgi:tRNA pseudouridine55 synthase
MDGILIVDKPRGPTSADVVAEVKRRLGAHRAGHTGTLDPMATGVLPIALGEGTKLAPFLLAEDKAYEGEVELGVMTDTLDAEGEVTGRADASGVTREAVLAALADWIGEKLQIPPMYAAIRQGGKRLYELARAGIEVEREARPVRIDRLDLLAFDPPVLRIAVACSKGTYVRSLVRDLGAALGCGATLIGLRRTAAGAFTLADAIPLRDVGRASTLVDPVRAVGHLPPVPLDAAGLRDVVAGRPLPAGSFAASHPAGQKLRLMTQGGRLAAVAEIKDDRIRTLRVFNYGLSTG